jgi:PAS domain S-box-containing protein
MNSIANFELSHNHKSGIDRHNNRRRQSRRISDEMFRLLVESMNEGVIIINNDGVIIFVNNQFCNMLGCSNDDLIGKPVISIIESSNRDELKQNILDCLSTLDVTRVDGGTIGVKWLSDEGNIIFSRISPQIITDKEYQENLFFALVTDITDSQKVQEALIQSKKELHILSGKLLTAQETDRKRIANDLHDSIGQCLSAVKFKIEELIETAQAESNAINSLNVLIPLLQNATVEVRRIAMDLRPSILDDLGLKATINWFSREFRAIYPSIELVVHLEVEEDDLSDRLKTVLFRIIQESLNNIAKHAKATLVHVSLKNTQKHLHLLIEDNGVGLLKNDHRNSFSENIGLGLSSMKERVEQTDGIFKIHSTMGQGMTIQASWPWNPPQRHSDTIHQDNFFEESK